MALPLYDSQPTRRAPLITYFLVAANFVIFLITPMAGFADWYGEGRTRECNQAEVTLEYGAIPKELTTNKQQPAPTQITEACEETIQPYEKTPWLSAFSSMFLHSDWLHLTGNVIFLFVIGVSVEDRLGRLRYFLSYLVFGLVAVYGFALTSPDSTVPLIGASGAIAGVLGAYLILNPRGRIVSLVPPIIVLRLPVWVVLGSWFVVQWLSLSDSESNVAYTAHIYGFMAGVALAILARRAGPVHRPIALSSG